MVSLVPTIDIRDVEITVCSGNIGIVAVFLDSAIVERYKSSLEFY